jgi:ABC-type Na+ transport system ATPase subunit NatA
MQVYALEAIPELHELSPEIIKAEIQQLSDRIKAKKILSEQIEEEVNLRHEKSGEDRLRQQVLIGKLRDLITDGNFVRLSTRKDSTQRAMQAYALEAIPELHELSSEIIKAEIRQLSDQIKAKKILNK